MITSPEVGFINRLMQRSKVDFPLPESPIITNISPYTIDAFLKIGKEGLEKAGYKKGTIDKAVKEYDKNIHRFLPEVIKDIQSEFDLNVWIEKEEIRDRLAMIYKRHNILYTVKLNTIKEYFLVDETKDKQPYKYILKVLIKDFGIF